MNPRWREDPSYPLSYIKSMLDVADLEAVKSLQKEKGKEAWKKMTSKIGPLGRMSIRWWISEAVKGAEMREMGKSEMVRIGEIVRMIALEAGRRLVIRQVLDQPTDVYHCSLPELTSILSGYWDGTGLKHLVKERQRRKQEFEALSAPDIIINDSPQYAVSTPFPAGSALRGLAVASGRASGTARLIYHPQEGIRLEPGDILVAPSTDPAWTPLFLKASAIVMETGGLLSHGAIVAREYGIPAVINVPGAMKLLHDGSHITVDGDEGKVVIED